MDCIICNVDHEIIKFTDCVEQENIFFTLKRLTSYYYKFWKLYLYLTILSMIDLPATYTKKMEVLSGNVIIWIIGVQKGRGNSANAGKTNGGGAGLKSTAELVYVSNVFYSFRCEHNIFSPNSSTCTVGCTEIWSTYSSGCSR